MILVFLLFYRYVEGGQNWWLFLFFAFHYQCIHVFFSRIHKIPTIICLILGPLLTSFPQTREGSGTNYMFETWKNGNRRKIYSFEILGFSRIECVLLFSYFVSIRILKYFNKMSLRNKPSQHVPAVRPAGCREHKKIHYSHEQYSFQ